MIIVIYMKIFFPLYNSLVCVFFCIASRRINFPCEITGHLLLYFCGRHTPTLSAFMQRRTGIFFRTLSLALCLLLFIRDSTSTTSPEWVSSLTRMEFFSFSRQRGNVSSPVKTIFILAGSDVARQIRHLVVWRKPPLNRPQTRGQQENAFIRRIDVFAMRSLFVNITGVV